MNVIYDLDKAVGSKEGWTYCLVSPCEDKIKIGMTKKDSPRCRVEENRNHKLYQGMVFSWSVRGYWREWHIHQALKDFASPKNPRSELFLVSSAFALDLALNPSIYLRDKPHLSSISDYKDQGFIVRLKRAMAIARVNQVELACKVGVTSQAVQKWCCGETHPRPSKIKKIAIALGVSDKWLVAGSGFSMDSSNSENRDQLLKIISSLANSDINPLLHIARRLSGDAL